MRPYKQNNIRLSVVFKEIMKKYNLSGTEIAKISGASFGVANQLLHDKPTSEKFVSNLINRLGIKDKRLMRRLIMAYLFAKFKRVDADLLKRAGFIK